MTTLKSLQEQKLALERQIAELQQKSRSEAIAKIKELLKESGLKLADLSERAVTGKSAKPAKKVPPKYRNKSTGETWSGRGLQPNWLKAAIAAGKKIEDFAI
jgi:DNA-binding protein H-NS